MNDPNTDDLTLMQRYQRTCTYKEIDTVEDQPGTELNVYSVEFVEKFCHVNTRMQKHNTVWQEILNMTGMVKTPQQQNLEKTKKF